MNGELRVNWQRVKKFWKHSLTDLLSIGSTETAHVEVILFDWRKIKQSNVHCVQLNNIQ